MKRKLICALLLAAALSSTASAYRVPHNNQMDNLITFTAANCDPQDQAEMLQKLGLFLGTDKGFELDRSMTRAEAAAMLCRFLGGQTEADSGSYPHPFTDVPAWASNAVGWLYQNKLTYGISDKQYGAAQPVTAEQFAVFLSRALCGQDDMQDELLTENEAFNLKQSGFRRSHAVAMSVRALMTEDIRDEGRTLAQKLAEKGVFSAETFLRAAWDVIPPKYVDYDRKAVLAGIPYGEITLSGYLSSAATGENCPLDYFYLARADDGKNELYQVDWKTLAPTLLDSRDAMSGDSVFARYFGTLDGTDYVLLETLDGSSGRLIYTSRLYSVAGKTAKLEAAEDALGEQPCTTIDAPEGTISFTIEDGVGTIDSSGVHLRSTKNPDGETETLYTGRGFFIQQTVKDTETILSSIRTDTGETIDSYTIPHDMVFGKLEPRTVAPGKGGLTGEGGLYEYDGQGRLTQRMENAVHDCFGDFHGVASICLTHAPGKRIPGEMGACGGDTLVRVDDETGGRETLVDASAEIEIAGLIPYDNTVFFEFYSAKSLGMGHHDKYTYFYNSATRTITVQDFEAGRAELLEGWDPQNPQGYKEEYIRKEQARIDATWNSKQKTPVSE